MQNVSTQASLGTRIQVALAELPFVTRCILFTCMGLYAVVAVTGFDHLTAQICLSAPAVARGEVYRYFTAALTHGGLLHLVMNMLALSTIGPPLERALGSLQFGWVMLLICVLGDTTYVAAAYLASFLPFLSRFATLDFLHQCAIGFSGVLFGLLLIDADINGAAKSFFGLFTVPARLYPFLLLMVWQVMVPQTSLLGHLTGLLIGQLFVMHLLRWALPSSAAYQRVERSVACATCFHRSGFITHTAGSSGDSVLPISRPPGGGHQGLSRGAASPTSPRGASWLPFMPFPASSNRLADLFRSLSTQAEQQADAALPGVRLGDGDQPSDPKLAAAQAAEARLARGGGSKGGGGGKSGGSGSSSSSSTTV